MNILIKDTNGLPLINHSQFLNELFNYSEGLSALGLDSEEVQKLSKEEFDKISGDYMFTHEFIVKGFKQFEQILKSFNQSGCYVEFTPDGWVITIDVTNAGVVNDKSTD